MRLRSFVLGHLSLVILLGSRVRAEDAGKIDPHVPYRTDSANANLPWYKPKALEFPPHHSDHRVSGELVSADFIRRKGQFRASKTGELMDFTLPPYGAINYLFAEADLRDVPLGTYFLFFLNQNEDGGFTRLATMQDQYTMDMGHGFSYKLDEAKLTEGKLITTRHKVSGKTEEQSQKELLVTPETRVWQGEKQIKLEDLKPGDELLCNLTGKTAANPGHCTDLYVGADTHALTTERQWKKFAEFTQKRGLPAWINKSEGDKFTITLFSGDVPKFKKTWLNDLAVGKDINVAVANAELRTWNPPTDKERGTILAVQNVPTDCYGCSGVRLELQVKYMLEGFRRGHEVRLFCSGWTVKDTPYGESLMGYGYARLQTEELKECTPQEYPAQFPFRTDYGNRDLPWFRLKAGETPPPFSEHDVLGELASVNADLQGGQFRMDRTGEMVTFSLIPEGGVKYLNANAKLADIPTGTRCRFHLYQDEKGAFTKASLVEDEFSFLAENAIVWRIESLRLSEGKIRAARQIPDTKNYNGDFERIPDIGRTELLVNADTRIWKGDQQIKPADLAVNDALLVNVSAELPGSPSHCTDIWVGADTHKLVAERQGKKLAGTKPEKKKR